MANEPGRKPVRLSQVQAAYLIVTVVAMLPHIFLLFFFRAIGVYPMSYINAASVVVYVSVIFLIMNSNMFAASIFITVEVAVYSFASMVLVGYGAGAHLFLINVLLAHFMFIPSIKIYRTAMVPLIVAVFAGQVVYGYMIPPVYSNQALHLLSLLIPLFTIAMILLELALNRISEQFTVNTLSSRIDRLSREVMVDPLTNLWNRSYIMQKKNYERKGENIVIVMLDIDDFKQVNDRYGHAVGDEVLIRFAGMMRDKFRSTDGLVRWGGEEFVIVLHGVMAAEAQKLLEIFIEQVAGTPITYGSIKLRITVTAGICYLERGMTILDAIDVADSRMYYGKKHGKNQVVC